MFKNAHNSNGDPPRAKNLRVAKSGQSQTQMLPTTISKTKSQAVVARVTDGQFSFREGGATGHVKAPLK